jgi:hypothetical protein
MMKTGPNDARRVVWAISEYFSFFLRVLLILNIIARCYQCTKRSGKLTEGGDDEWKAVTTKTGPNDASCVVWAI